jgi:hypothetical protein
VLMPEDGQLRQEMMTATARSATTTPILFIARLPRPAA